MSPRAPISSSEHLRRMQWQATDMLAEHQLLGESYWDNGRGARWLIGQPRTVTARCEIIAGIFGSLVVHGDFDTARFASYSDESDAWSRLRWMADCTDVGYYVDQKASIGMGRASVGETYDSDVAQHDLRAFMQDLKEEEWETGELYQLCGRAMGHTDNEHELRQLLSDGDKGWDLWEHTFGRIVPTQVVISHVALNRCAWLLRERHGNEGPPECRPRAELDARTSAP